MMKRYTILLADNDSDFLATKKEVLENAGFKVIVAKNPFEARRILNDGNIDLAILDMRLEKDDDERDTSGLTIAKESAPSVPKIILTNFPSTDAAREALRRQSSGQRAAVDFIAKNGSDASLVSAIYRTLKALEEEVINTLKSEYLKAQRQRDIVYYLGLLLLIFGKVIILIGALLVLSGKADKGAYTVIVGVVMDGAGASFWRFLNDANERVEKSRSRWLDRLKNHNDEGKRNES